MFKTKTPYGWVFVYYDDKENWYAVSEATGTISVPYKERHILIKDLMEAKCKWE